MSLKATMRPGVIMNAGTIPQRSASARVSVCPVMVRFKACPAKSTTTLLTEGLPRSRFGVVRVSRGFVRIFSERRGAIALLRSRQSIGKQDEKMCSVPQVGFGMGNVVQRAN